MSAAVRTAEDRTMLVPADHVVRTAWVPMHRIVMACTDRMAPASVERSFQRVIQHDGEAMWPPPLGVWIDHPEDGILFSLRDGRHEYVASLMAGRRRILVAWVEPMRPADDWRDQADLACRAGERGRA